MRRCPPAFWCSLCVILIFLSPTSGCSVDKTGLPVSGPAPPVFVGGTGTGGSTSLSPTGSGGTVGSGGAGITGTTGTGGAGTGGVASGSGGATSGDGGTGDAVPGTGGMTDGTGHGRRYREGRSPAREGWSVSGGAMGGGAGGAPSVVVSLPGCADGTREAFVNVVRFPSIAGCAGGWTVPGVLTPASMLPACARAAGNSGLRPNGAGCTVEDLCALGWHVCLGARELTTLGVTCQGRGDSRGKQRRPPVFRDPSEGDSGHCLHEQRHQSHGRQQRARLRQLWPA